MLMEVVMQEGTVFYLISWLAVWYIFFMENGPAQKRSRHLILALTLIICTGIYMDLVQIQINFILVPILFWSFYQWRNAPNQKLVLIAITIFGIMVTFACTRILTMLYPVWLIVDWKILCSFLVVLIAALFQKGWGQRWSAIIIGFLCGQTVYAVLLSRSGMPISGLFSLEAMDLLSVMFLFNGLLYKVEQWFVKRAMRKSLMTVQPRNREMR